MAGLVPSSLTVSYSIFRVMIDEFNIDVKKFKFFAGHSLGEYSALVSSGSLNFLDALFLLYERGKSMQEAVPVGKGCMIAVLGFQYDELYKLLDSFDKRDGVCDIANDNAQGQIILSGDLETVASFQKVLKEKKIKVIPLKVSAPFHCALMRSAAKKMEDKINKINFKKPSTDIISNVTAEAENNPENIKRLLVEQIYSPVRWRESMINISENNVSNFIEIGPGKVLSGMIKRTINNANCFPINTIADIKNLHDKF